jgi:redox-sensitive bicupin YhaK (pirin superfamily)
MITVRKGQDRGFANRGWLQSWHSFSFGSYQDADHMGFGCLRVINEDIIQPNEGFPTHGHEDMEIITYVLEGALAHKDSLGTGSVIRPSEVQRMSAGTGIRHSEYNASETETVHLLQIWILPEKQGTAPSYEQKAFDLEQTKGQWVLLESQDGRAGSVTIAQDVNLFVARLETGYTITFSPATDRKLWLQVARGSITLNGHLLEAGDGVAIEQALALAIVALAPASEVLLFDMAI